VIFTMQFGRAFSGLLLLAIAAFLPSLAAEWTSDEYALVYGVYGGPRQSLTEALSRSASGILTPHRTFEYAFTGNGGLAGPTIAHALALALHILCSLLFAALIWRMFRSFILTYVTTGWFIVSPWLSETVIWWSATTLTASTIFIFAGAHFFLSSISNRSNLGIISLALASVSVFAGLCVYDMWIPGFLLFFGIWIVRGWEFEKFKRSVYWRDTATHICVMAIPFVLWCMWVAIAGPRANGDSPDFAARLNLTPYRIPISLVSLHLRVINWFVSAVGGQSPDWVASWKLGITALSAPAVLVTFVLGCGSLLLHQGCFTARIGNAGATKLREWCQYNFDFPSKTIDGCAPRSPLFEAFPWRILFFAWMMFLGSRLAMVLGGGIGVGGRFNYCAGMAVALAAAGVAGWAWHRWLKQSPALRWLASAGFGASVLLLALAAAGHARQIALSSQAEAYTIERLAQEIAEHPQLRSIIVVGTPVPDIQTPDVVLNYFAEDDGSWLNYVLHAYFGYDTRAHVVRSEQDKKEYPTPDASFVWAGEWPQARLTRASP
jgi:hypothetical protein